MLINKAISNLFSGVSQQPISTRLTNYAEVQENGYSTVIDGLKKRPNTNFINELVNANTNTDSFVHFIDRDDNEKYVVLINNEDIKVYDLEGNQMTVNAPSGFSYLNSSNPYLDFGATTIADYTIITNKKKVIEMGAVSPSNPKNVCYICVKTNIASVQHRAIIDGVISAYISVQGEDSISIAYNLAQEIITNNGAGYTVTISNNTIKIVKTSGNFTQTEVSDGWGDNALVCLNNGVANVTDLPVFMDSNFIVRVNGINDGRADDYYVHFDKGWKETKLDGLKNSFNNTTMPYKLVRTALNTFEFNVITYDSRVSGDDKTSPEPSFVGRTINDVFFHKNRLGFLSDESVVMSRNASYFNFWQQSKATGVIDTDPIDVAVSGTNVNILKHATSFNNTLLLFSDNTQFQLTTSNNQPLTPKTITINPTTKYKSDNLAKPVGIGQDVYFSVSKGNYTGFMEYFVTPGTFTSEASEVTKHVPKYVPNNVYKMLGSSEYDVLIALNKTTKNELYIYKFLWQGNEKAQSSWSVWKLNPDEEIVGGEIVKNLMYLVIKKSNKIFLQYIDLQDNYQTDNFNIPILLDNLTKVVGVYDSETNLTKFSLPYSSTAEYVVVKDNGQALTIHSKTKVADKDNLFIIGDHNNFEYYIGNTYTLRFVLSELILKDQNNVSIYEYKLSLKNMKIHYNDTGYFKVQVTPPFRDTNEYVFTGNNIGVSALLGSINLDSNFFRIPLMCGSKGIKIEIINDKFIPCSLQSIEWNTQSSGSFQRR